MNVAMSGYPTASIRDRERLVASVVGIAISPLVLPLVKFTGPLQQFLEPAKLLLIGVLLLSGVAGAAAALAAKAGFQSRARVIPVSAQLGIRAALLCALCAGALLTVLATIETGKATGSIMDRTLRSRALMVLLVSLAALLPSVLCGFVGGLVGGRCIASRVPEAPAARACSPIPWFRWVSSGVVCLAIAGLLSPLSFLGRPLLSDPPPVVVEVKPLKKPAPVIEPPFHYQPPANLESAQFNEIQPAFIKTIPNVAENCPLALSPDGVLLAFGERSGGVTSDLCVFDLHRFTKVFDFKLPSYPEGLLAWREDQRAIACVIGSGQGRRIWILRLDDGSAVQLPRPQGRDVPTGELFWWQSKEIAFFPEDEPALYFDLDTLRLHPLEESAAYRKLDEAERQQWQNGPRAKLPGRSGWRVSVQTVITSVTPPPRRHPEMEWELSGKSIASFSHPSTPVSRGFSTLVVSEAGRLFCSPDGSKLAQLRDGQIMVTYMKLQAAQEHLLEIEMPLDRAEIENTEWESLVRERQLCVLLYGPMINPLSQQVVGPDYTHANGPAQLVEWRDKKAIFMVQTHLGESLDGAIASTLHHWQLGGLKEWNPARTGQWWAVAKRVAGIVPEDLPETDSPQSFSLEAHPGYQLVTKTPAKSRPSPPSQPEPPVSANEVRAFIIAHHEKTSRRDLPGMIANYDSVVDFLGKGEIARDAIAADEQAHWSKWPLGNEKIVGEIDVNREGGTWRASYSMEFSNQNASGEWLRGHADMTLQLREDGKDLFIVWQRANVHDVTDSKSTKEAAEPAAPKQPQGLPITVPKPCFVASMRAEDHPQIEITDQIHFIASGIRWHRTYREFSKDGKVVNTCRAIYDGSVRSVANGRMVYIGSQGWERGLGTNTFVTTCSGSARALVGKSFYFEIHGSGMVESSSGRSFRLIQK